MPRGCTSRRASSTSTSTSYHGEKGTSYSRGRWRAHDGFTLRSCVTTVADAGSPGWRNFDDFKARIIDKSKTRVIAFLNIVGHGMGGGTVEQNLADMEVQADRPTWR